MKTKTKTLAAPSQTEPRLVTVAKTVASIQRELTANDKRIETLQAELDKLGERNEVLIKQQVGHQRELDKLAAGSTIQT